MNKGDRVTITYIKHGRLPPQPSPNTIYILHDTREIFVGAYLVAVGDRDYAPLSNKPYIEGVELDGDVLLGSLGIPYVFYGTTAEWDSQPTLISVKDAIYVYTDFDVDGQGNNIPGIKIGDGKGYLIDAPFTNSKLYAHIQNNIIHITAAEREFWNNKIRCYISESDAERLIFTTQ